MVLREPSASKTDSTCARTLASVPEGVMLGTRRIENLPLTVPGTTVLAPGSANAPSMPWTERVGKRHRDMRSSVLSAPGSVAAPPSPASRYASTSKSIAAYLSRSAGVTGATSSRIPLMRMRSWSGLYRGPLTTPLVVVVGGGTTITTGGSSFALATPFVVVVGCCVTVAAPFVVIDDSSPTPGPAGGSTKDAMRWTRSMRGSDATAPPCVPEWRSSVPPETWSSKYAMPRRPYVRHGVLAPTHVLSETHT
mmetsp:Transcript_10268/g.41552  ORF Transcript_10268/g.41552 Transcript_10268/m.41552 type:complete len:251 (-) Transcript_10268:752-1504(-)